MKTAIQGLIEQLRKHEARNMGNDLSVAYGYSADLAEDLLETEKQQIIEAATHGANFDKSPYSSAHEYYEKTFNNQ